MERLESNVIRSFNMIKKEMIELQDEIVNLRKLFEELSVIKGNKINSKEKVKKKV